MVIQIKKFKCFTSKYLYCLVINLYHILFNLIFQHLKKLTAKWFWINFEVYYGYRLSSCNMDCLIRKLKVGVVESLIVSFDGVVTQLNKKVVLTNKSTIFLHGMNRHNLILDGVVFQCWIMPRFDFVVQLVFTGFNKIFLDLLQVGQLPCCILNI